MKFKFLLEILKALMVPRRSLCIWPHYITVPLNLREKNRENGTRCLETGENGFGVRVKFLFFFIAQGKLNYL